MLSQIWLDGSFNIPIETVAESNTVELQIKTWAMMKKGFHNNAYTTTFLFVFKHAQSTNI